MERLVRLTAAGLRGTRGTVVTAVTCATHRRGSGIRRWSAPTVLVVQSPSSLIFLVLLGIWAAYFVQYWVRRRDHLATARSVEQFSAAMRVLERRDALPGVDLSQPAPRSYAVHPARAARPQVLVKRAVPAEPALVAFAERVEGSARRGRRRRPRAGVGSGGAAVPRPTCARRPAAGPAQPAGAGPDVPRGPRRAPRHRPAHRDGHAAAVGARTGRGRGRCSPCCGCAPGPGPSRPRAVPRAVAPPSWRTGGRPLRSGAVRPSGSDEVATRSGHGCAASRGRARRRRPPHRRMILPRRRPRLDEPVASAAERDAGRTSTPSSTTPPRWPSAPPTSWSRSSTRTTCP